MVFSFEEMDRSSASATYENLQQKHKQRISRDQEVEAYTNPTELFRCINYCRWEKAARRVKSTPDEASIWIASRDANNSLKWKYLPLHLVCLQSNPPRSIVKALLEAYPEAVLCRDYDGNLPIHYACLEGIEDEDVLKWLIEANPNTLLQKDHSGKTPLQMLEDPNHNTKKLNTKVKESMINTILWYQEKLMDKNHHYHMESRDPPSDQRLRKRECKTPRGKSRKNVKPLFLNRETSRHSVKEIHIEKKVPIRSKENLSSKATKELRAKNEYIRDLETELKGKGIKLEKNEQRIKELETKLRSTTEEKQKLGEDLSKSESSVNDVEMKIKSFVARNLRFEKKVATLEEDLASSKASNIVLQGQYQEVKEAEATDKNIKADLISKLAVSEHDCKLLQDKMIELENKNVSLQNQYDQIKADNESKQNYISEGNKLREQVQELQTVKLQHERTIEEQKLEFESTMIRIQQALSTQANEFSSLQANPFNDPSDDPAEGTSPLSSVDVGLSNAHQKVRELTQEKHDLKAETISLINTISLQEKEIAKLSAQVQSVESELDKKDSLTKEMQLNYEKDCEMKMKELRQKDNEIKVLQRKKCVYKDHSLPVKKSDLDGNSPLKSVGNKITLSNESINEPEQSNRILKGITAESQEENEECKSRLNSPSSDESVRKKIHGHNLTQEVSKLAYSLKGVSHTQTNLLQETCNREQQFKNSGTQDSRDRLIERISRQKREIELTARTRDQFMNTIAHRKDSLQKPSEAERKKIIELAEEKQKKIFLSAASQRESISNTIDDLHNEIELLQQDFDFL